MIEAQMTSDASAAFKGCSFCAGRGCAACDGERSKALSKLQTDIDRRDGTAKQKIKDKIDQVNPPPSQPVETSEAAADKIKSNVRNDRGKVYRVILSRGSRGATDQEIQEILGMDGNTQRPRRVELEAANLIRRKRDEKGKLIKRRTKGGGTAQVWIIVPGVYPDPWIER